MAIVRRWHWMCAALALSLAGGFASAQTLATALQPPVVEDAMPAHDATTGTLAGHAATDGGAATYTVPIVVPPGRAGMQPSLALSYNSRSGDGVMGLGWTITGLSAIHRCPQTPEQDGRTLGVGYTTNDKLCLDGQRLVSVGGTYGSAGAEYRTEIDSHARIFQVNGNIQSGTACFRVEEKSGRILHYGGLVTGSAPSLACTLTSAHSRVVPGGLSQPMSWLVEKIEDRVGNNQFYSYTDYGNGEVLISGITYTGLGLSAGDRTVNFSYADRGSAVQPATAPQASDKSSSYLAGGLTMQTQALTAVTTKIGNATARRLTPTYMASTYSGRLAVSALTECSYRGGSTSTCHSATQFTATNQQAGAGASAPTFHLSSLASLSIPTGQLTKVRQGVDTDRPRRQALRTFTTQGADDDAPDLVAAAGDMDGDGTRELALGRFTSSGEHDYLVQLAADRQVRGSVDVTGMLCYYDGCYGDFAGDGRSETIVSPRTTSDPQYLRLAVWTLGRGVVAGPTDHPLQLLPTNIPSVPLGPGVVTESSWYAPHAVDINGDGRTDIVMMQASTACGSDALGAKVGVFAYLNTTVVDPATGTIDASHPPTFLASGPIVCLNRVLTGPTNILVYTEALDHLVDFDGDGLPDLFITNSGLSGALPSNVPSLSRIVRIQTTSQDPTTHQWLPTAGLSQSCTDIGLINSDNTNGDDECHWSNGYATQWMDINGDGLDDFLIAQPAQVAWRVHLNQGNGHLGAAITTTGTGQHDGLDFYYTGSPAPNRFAFKYAGRVPMLDADGDGKPDLMVVSEQQKFAIKMCIFTTLPPQTNGEGCLGTGDTSSPQCPAYACPEDPGDDNGSEDHWNMPDGQGLGWGRYKGNIVFNMHGAQAVAPGYTTPDMAAFDPSAYHLAMVKFVQTGPAAVEARHIETSLVSTLNSGNAPTSGAAADVFGDGLGDLSVNLGCPFGTISPPGLNQSYAGCLAVDTLNLGPATIAVYASPTDSSTTQVATSTFATVNPFYINQNVGDGLVPGTSSLMAPLFDATLRSPSTVQSTFYSPLLPDLLANLHDGVGDYAAWNYEPLSLPITQGVIPLYTVPSTNGYSDSRHYYFTSSMPVVSGMVQNNGVGDQYGFRSMIYGYSEAMYNHFGRGFQGFHTITEGVASEEPERDLITTTIYNQKFPLTGKIASSCTYVPPSTPITSSALCNTSVAPIDVETETDTWICGLTSRTACNQGDTLSIPTGVTVYSPVLDTRRVSHFDLTSGAAVSHVLTVNAASTVGGASGWDPNGYGNLLSQLETTADDGAGGQFVSGRTVSTTNTYVAADTTSWWIDKLSKSVVNSSIAYASGHGLPAGWTAPARNVTTTYQWNGDRTPLSQTVQSGISNQEVTTTYAYPSSPADYGLPSSITVNAPSATPSSRQTKFTYTKGGTAAEADGYFVFTTTNPLLQATTTERSPYDGQAMKTTDPNNLKTVDTYDAFGRLTQTDYLDASGAALFFSRQFALTKCTGAATNPCPAGLAEDGNAAYAAYRLTSEQTAFQTTIDWFDVLGRKIKHAEHGFDGTFVETATDYDDMNTVDDKSTPFFFGHVAYFTAYGYDRLGRVVQKQSPGAELDPSHGDVMTSYTYNGSKTTIKVRAASVSGSGTCSGSTNLCMDMTRSYDALGRLEQTVQGSGSTSLYATTDFWYDAIGDLVAARDAEGNITRASYNDIGHRTDWYDPDAGHTLYTIDALGELVSQTDARGIVTANLYDALGRRTQRTATNASASDPSLAVIRDTWTYDPTGANGGIGLPGSAQRSKGASTSALSTIWSEIYSYETATKRLSLQKSTLDGQGLWQTSFSYDQYGREAMVGYPSGLVVFKLLTSYGQLQGLQNADSSQQVWWTHSAEDPWGNITAETYSGGLAGQHQTYASTGQFKEKKWTSGATVQDQWDYLYDSFGNLTQQSRATPLGTSGEGFQYDGLQRLTLNATNSCFTGSPFCVATSGLQYGYSPSGNLTFKSDFSLAGVGAYGYGVNGCGPHGVANVLQGSGTVVYNCDASGNVVSGSTLTASYDFANLPWSISRTGAGSSQFEYDANGQRFKEQSTSQSTWFGPRGFERTVPTGGVTTDRHELGPIVIDRTTTGVNTVYYQARDRQGSLATLGVLGSTATPDYRSYEPFGAARDGSFQSKANGTLNELPKTLRGFTGQEHLDDVRLIHMNGRVYDYSLGRFLSVDPVVQNPSNSQSLNPYSYILNNPLSGKDPSGYASVDTRSICFTSPGACGAVYGTDSAAALNALSAAGAQKSSSNGAERQPASGGSSVQILKYIDPSAIGDPKQQAALIETQNRANLFFNGDYDNPSVLEPLIDVGVVKGNDSYIALPNDDVVSSMQHRAEAMRAMGIEPDYVPYATAMAAIGDYSFNSLPPVAFVDGVRTMANAQSPWGIATGAAMAVTAVVPGLDELSVAAGASDRAGLTAAGRALLKHGSREGSAFPAALGNASAINRQGQDMVDEILTNPGSAISSRYHARYGDINEVRAPDGRGVRYDANGNFMGFLEPPPK